MFALRKRPRPLGAKNDVRPESGLIEYLQPLSFLQRTVVVRAAGVLTHLGRPHLGYLSAFDFGGGASAAPVRYRPLKLDVSS